MECVGTLLEFKEGFHRTPFQELLRKCRRPEGPAAFPKGLWKEGYGEKTFPSTVLRAGLPRKVFSPPFSVTNMYVNN